MLFVLLVLVIVIVRRLARPADTCAPLLPLAGVSVRITWVVLMLLLFFVLNNHGHYAREFVCCVCCVCCLCCLCCPQPVLLLFVLQVLVLHPAWDVLLCSC